MSRDTALRKAAPATIVAGLLAAQFFLPYLPDSRLRLDVVTGLLALGISIFLLRRAESELVTFYVLSCVSSAWCLLRVALAPSDFESSAMVVVNHSFSLLGAALAVVLRPRQNMLQAALTATWCVTLVTNLAALEQWRDPSSIFSQAVYDLYGGAFSFDYDAASSAEFQVLFAGRHTGIFNGMHALAIFNLVVIMLLLGGRYTDRGLLRTLALVGAIIGGVLSASKTFYLGAMVGVGMLVILRRVTLTRIWPGVLLALVLASLIVRLDRDSIVSRYYEELLRLDPEWVFGPRYGMTGNLVSTIEVIEDDLGLLLVGRGAELEGLNMADNAFLPLILVGGVVHLVLFYTPYAALVRTCWRAPTENPWPLVLLAIWVTLLAIGLGIPTFQLGRITAFVVFLTFLALAERSPAPSAGLLGRAEPRAQDKPDTRSAAAPST